MARHASRVFAALLMAVLSTISAAQEPGAARVPPAPGLERISIAATSEQRRQILDAIAASPTVSQRFGELAADGRLVAIEVVEPPAPARVSAPFSAGPPVKGPFAAALDGPRIVLSSRLLTLLRTGRLVDVVLSDDVYPDPTVFALAHLADHLANPESPLPRAGESLDAYQKRRVTNEAQAYVAAWNGTVEEAVRRRGSALDDRQVASLLIDCRYSFAFLGLRDRTVAGPTLAWTGRIEPTETNIDAVVRTLQQSSLADLE